MKRRLNTGLLVLVCTSLISVALGAGAQVSTVPNADPMPWSPVVRPKGDPKPWSSVVRPKGVQRVLDVGGAQDALRQAQLSVQSMHASRSNLSFPVERTTWPTAKDHGAPLWKPQALLLAMPRGADFELLVAKDNYYPCDISAQNGGGMVVLRVNAAVVNYGCWQGMTREGDNSTWIQLEMESGMLMRLPLKAFSKRALQPR